MLDSSDFIKSLIDKKYTHLCVVPCSFAKNIINESINNILIEYLPCSSEAVACSIAAGLKMSGKKPIIIVQSSGLTNMGSCITSLLKTYGIKIPMLVSWRTYNSGDSEIQHKHLATNLPSLIKAYGYSYEILSKQNISTAISQIEKCNTSNLICILEKETFSKVALQKKHELSLNSRIKRSEFLKILNNYYKEKKALFIGTTGNTAREMYTFMPNTNNFYMAGNMGGALSLGLGAAKGGNLGRYSKQINLTYIIFDNESNKSTGGQKTYQDHINYSLLAKSANIQNTYIANTNRSFLSALKKKQPKAFILSTQSVHMMPKPQDLQLRL